MLHEFFPISSTERWVLTHDPEDPSTWKILLQRKTMWGWKTTSTRWYLTRALAERAIEDDRHTTLSTSAVTLP